MTVGRTLPAKIRLSTAVDVEPQIELMLDAPAKVGKTVRVTVFDEDLFRTGPLARDYNKVFSTFIGSLAPVVPEAVRDPASLIGDGKNGVLLTLEADVVDQVPKAAQAKHQKWAFGAFKNITTCNPGADGVLVDVAFGMRDKNNEIAFGPLIRVPRSARFRMRRIVVIVAEVGSNALLYSNTWRTGEFVKQNPQASPTLLDSHAREVAIAARVGGSGEGSGAPAPAGRAPPDTDVTGFYEAFTSSSQEMGRDFPALMVQLDMAGGAVAGWWAPPPERVTGHAAHRITQPTPLPPIEAGKFGVLLGHFEDGEFKILWGPTDVSEDPRPDLVGALKTAPNAASGSGVIRVTGELRLEMTLTRGEQTARYFLAQASPAPRWSNATLDQVIARAAENSSRVRRSIRGHQQRPIPNAFWLLLQRDMVETGTLGRLIVRYESTPTNDPSTRRGLREQIANYLQGLTAIDEHNESVVAHFTLLASNIRFSIAGVENDQPRSTYAWLQKIAKDFMSGQAEQNLDPETILELVPRGFREVGIAPTDLFVYKAEFFSLGAEIPLGLGVGAYVFEVEFQRKQLRNGIERDPPAGDPWQNVKKKLFGGFGDIGISLGPRLKAGSASNLLSDASFRSFHDLAPDRFNQADFYIISAAALTVDIALLNAQAASTAVIVMTVNSNDGGSVRMVAGVDSTMTTPDPSKPNTQLIKKFELFNLSIASLTLGYGWMTENKPTPVRPITTETEPQQTLGNATRTFVAFFRKNSATLEGRNLSAFEEAVAIERAIFVSGGGHARAAGHASPEGPDNDGLSQRRAENVIQVLQAALGNQLAVTTQGIGFGHRAALAEGMIRPEDIAPGDNQRRALYRKQEETEFPRFRVVMLIVNGVLLIEIKAGKAVLGG